MNDPNSIPTSPIRSAEGRVALFHLLTCQKCRLELSELLLRGEHALTWGELPLDEYQLVDNSDGDPHLQPWHLLTAFDGLARTPAGDALSLGLEALRQGLQDWEHGYSSTVHRLFHAAELFAESHHAREEAAVRHLMGLYFTGQSDPLAALDCFEGSSPLDSTSDPELMLFSAFAKADCFATCEAAPDARRCLNEARALYVTLAKPEIVPYVLWIEGRISLRLNEAAEFEGLDPYAPLRASLADFCERRLFEEAFLTAVDLVTELRLRDRRSPSNTINPTAVEVLELLKTSFASSHRHAELLTTFEESIPLLPDSSIELQSRISSYYRFRTLGELVLGLAMMHRS